VNPLALLKCRTLAIVVAALSIADLFALTGCVYPVGAAVVVGPPPVPGPSLNVALYGTPAGYYYMNNPVFIYRGRPAYYYGGRRFFYRPGNRYYYRRGYRYYY
jgi:hypothetical protein